MDVTIRVDDRELKQKLNALGGAAKNLKPAFNHIGDELLDYYGGTVFRTQGQALGESWRSLAPSTVAARTLRQGYYRQAPAELGKILIWTGRLKNSFAKKVSSLKLVLSNRQSYFKYHQLGKRPMFKITTDVIQTVKSGINRYFNTKI